MNASVDKLKPPFAGSISQSANRFFFFHFLLKKKNKQTNKQNKNGEEPFRRSKVTLPFCLTYSESRGCFFMLSPHIWATCLALIPPSFLSLNPLRNFSDCCNFIPAVTTERFVWEFPVQLWRFWLKIENAVTRNKPCRQNQFSSEWVEKIFIRSWVELY